MTVELDKQPSSRVFESLLLSWAAGLLECKELEGNFVVMEAAHSAHSASAIKKCNQRLDEQLRPDLQRALAERRQLDEQVGEYEALDRQLGFMRKVQAAKPLRKRVKLEFADLVFAGRCLRMLLVGAVATCFSGHPGCRPASTLVQQKHMIRKHRTVQVPRYRMCCFAGGRASGSFQRLALRYKQVTS